MFQACSQWKTPCSASAVSNLTQKSLYKQCKTEVNIVKVFSFLKIQYKQLPFQVVFLYSVQNVQFLFFFKELNINIEFGLFTSKQNPLDMIRKSFTTAFKLFQSIKPPTPRILLRKKKARKQTRSSLKHKLVTYNSEVGLGGIKVYQDV